MPRPKIYVIDDDQAILDSTAFLLGTSGSDCACFSDPLKFLLAVEELEPGCILTDLRMPEMNGYELQRALRERAPGWPIVLMTSENGSLNKEAVTARGFAGFLRKPFAADDLMTAIEACTPAIEHLRREPGPSNGH